MQTASGKSILERIAIGPLCVYKKAEVHISRTSTLTSAQEWDRFEAARQTVRGQLERLYEKALDEAGGETAAII